MFIHWGIGSMQEARGQISADKYTLLANQFNPSNFNADEWVALAKEAGMKYMVLTTVHGHSFCLFDSKVSDFTSVKSGAKRDFVAEYVQACGKLGMRIGFYYGLGERSWSLLHESPSVAKYVEYVHAQVKELCTQYGKIDILWYDGERNHDAKTWQSAKLSKMVRELQPEILINNRLRLPEDFDTPEQYIAPSEPGRLWECNMTMNDHWFYSVDDNNWKSTSELIHNLVQCVSEGGNYLLDVGPKPDGTFPKPAVKRLNQIGKWMTVNGESIYGAGRCPFGGSMANGPTTAKDNTVYLHVFRWPIHNKMVWVAGLKNEVKSAYILADKKKVNFIQQGVRHLLLQDLPPDAPDDYDSIIVLEPGERLNGY